jgi:hypothetical protein
MQEGLLYCRNSCSLKRSGVFQSQSSPSFRSASGRAKTTGAAPSRGLPIQIRPACASTGSGEKPLGRRRSLLSRVVPLPAICLEGLVAGAGAVLPDVYAVSRRKAPRQTQSPRNRVSCPCGIGNWTSVGGRRQSGTRADVAQGNSMRADTSEARRPARGETDQISGAPEMQVCPDVRAIGLDRLDADLQLGCDRVRAPTDQVEDLGSSRSLISGLSLHVQRPQEGLRRGPARSAFGPRCARQTAPRRRHQLVFQPARIRRRGACARRSPHPTGSSSQPTGTLHTRARTVDPSGEPSSYDRIVVPPMQLREAGAHESTTRRRPRVETDRKG